MKKETCIHTTISTAIIVVGIMMSACSTMKHSRSLRSVANVEKTAAEARVEKVLVFNRSHILPVSAEEAKNLRSRFESNLYDIKRSDPNLNVQFVKSTDLGPEVVYRISPEIDQNNRNIVKIFHAEDAFNDGVTTVELYKFLDNIYSDKVATSYSLIEMSINALQDDKTSIHAMAKLRQLAIDAQADSQSAFVFKVNEANFSAHSSKNLPEWKNFVSALDKEVRQERTVINKLGKQRSEVLKTLDAAPESKQFRYLVSIGDRNGAADLIKAYLPWEEMLPFEKQFWEKQLSLMRNPLPLDQRVLLYRGLQDDALQTPVIDGKKLSLEEAVKEQDAFVMSTLMTKNQGSWNRRLRSLTSMNEKYIGMAKRTQSSEFSRAARISTFLKNHSLNPVGSPFLSFTPSFETANTFGKQRVSAFLMDPRALIFNYASEHTHEHEYLLPLATFPDEIFALHDVKLSPVVEKRDGWIHNQVLQKLMREEGEAKGLDTYTKVLANTKSYFNHYYKIETSDLGPALIKHAPEIAKLPSPGPVKPTDASCKNILKAFWK